MNIIIIGPPASGKGTHCNFITNKYNFFNYISMGEILRNSKDIIIKDKISKGLLIDDNLTFKILNEYINNIKNNKNNLILDGFPRTYNQAKILHNNIKINIIIEFILEKENIIKRILGRKIHKKSGRIYHDIYNPPLIKDIDDITGEKLETRNDDNIEVINKRIEEYNNNINNIKLFYNKQINNKNIKTIKINSNDTIENIKNMLLYKLDKILISESSSIR